MGEMLGPLGRGLPQLGDKQDAPDLSEKLTGASTNFECSQRWPMRIAEAQITFAVDAGIKGAHHEAAACGHRAPAGDRNPIPRYR